MEREKNERQRIENDRLEREALELRRRQVNLQIFTFNTSLKFFEVYMYYFIE